MGVRRSLVAVATLAALAAAPAELSATAGEPSAAGDDHALEALLAELPSKEEEENTVTNRYRRDLVDYCRARGCSDLTAVEVGCFRGYTTAVLSRLFGRVFVLDNDADHLAAARARSRGRTNLVFLRVQLYSAMERFDWSELLAENDVHVAVVDAGHWHRQVASDIQSALRLPLVDTLIFDDYGLIRDVRRAVDAHVEAGTLECRPIGEELPKLLRAPAVAEAARYWNQGPPDGDPELREGQLCSVRARGPWPQWSQALLGQHFSCHRAGDFSLGGLWQPWEHPAEVSFRVAPGRLLLTWPPGSEREPREVGFAARSPGYRLLLEEETPPLSGELLFAATLRAGFFVRGGLPEHLCVSVEDTHRLAEWTYEGILRTLGESQ